MASDAEIYAAAKAIRRLAGEPGLEQAGPWAIAKAALEAVERERQGGRVTLANWTPTEADWDGTARLYARTGFWSPQFGPDPELPGCQCPPDILAKWHIRKGAA